MIMKGLSYWNSRQPPSPDSLIGNALTTFYKTSAIKNLFIDYRFSTL